MSAFHPITPLKAVEFVEAAGVHGACRLIADFAAAGLIKSYALSIETVEVGGQRACVRDSAVPAELWQRVVREGVVDDVWGGGTVRLPATDLVGGDPEVRITGIRFSEKFLQRLVDHHNGAISRPVPPRKISPAPVRADDSEQVVATAPKPKQSDPSAIPLGALVVTVDQAMAALGLGRTKLNELMNDGTLVKKKIGRAVRIEVASIYAVLEISSER